MTENHETERLRNHLAELEAELERVRLTLDVVGTMDLDAGILNRNGILDALERGRRWMARRGDIYGLLVVRLPGLTVPPHRDAAHVELVKHVAATIGAGVREVDDVGRVDDRTFAAALADLAAGSARVVAQRVCSLVQVLVESTPELGGEFRVGAVEVMNATHTSGAVLEAALAASATAEPGGFLVDRI